VGELQGDAMPEVPLESTAFSMQALAATYTARSDQTGAMFLHAFACLLHALAGRNAEAEAQGLAAAALFTAGRGMYMLPFCMYFTATASLVLAQAPGVPQADERRARADATLARLQRWAAHNTELAPLWRLLCASRAACDGDAKTVGVELDEALTAVRQQGNLFMVGLVHRRRAELLQALNAPGAGVEKAEANTAFLRWGARALVVEAGERETPAAAVVHGSTVSSEGGRTSTVPGNALDLATLMKAVQAVTSEIALGPLLDRMLHVLRENAGARRAAIVLKDANDWTLHADSEALDSATATQARALETAEDVLPLPVLRTVLNTASPVLVDDLQTEPRWNRLEYFAERGGRSVLCLPLVKQGQVVGALYLENDVLAAAFSPQRIEFLGLLSGNVVNAIDNARLYQQLRELADSLEQRVAERTRELRESEARTLSILQNAPVPMTVTRRSDGTLVYVNAHAAATVDMTREQLTGQAAQVRYRDPADRERMYALYREQGVVRDFETCLVTGTGAERWTLISMVPIVYDGEPAELATVIDITERKTMEEKLRLLATTDALTGVANRGHFMQRAAAELERARRYGRPLSMVMLDIDYFKQINDRYGHSAGDEAIRALTAASVGLVRQQDLVGRLGGEEFGILMPETDHEAARRLAERLRVRIAELDVPLRGEETVRMTASFGVSALSPTQDNVDDLLARADRALYVSKRNGRNRVSIG